MAAGELEQAKVTNAFSLKDKKTAASFHTREPAQEKHTNQTSTANSTNGTVNANKLNQLENRYCTGLAPYPPGLAAFDCVENLG